VHRASVGADPPRPGLCVHDRLACTESLRTNGRYVDGLLILIRRSRLRRRGSPLGTGEFLGGRARVATTTKKRSSTPLPEIKLTDDPMPDG
jgi:hypothetical protein